LYVGAGVGRSFLKKLGIGCGEEKINRQEGPVSWENNNKNQKKAQEEKKEKVLTKETDPWGKSHNGIFLDGALVGAGSLKP
jgi:hypothetical protein